jgi:hypothetical protein
MSKSLANWNSVLRQHNEAVANASSAAAKERVSRNVFNALRESFGQTTDSMARSRPGMFHHLYEWGSIGDQSQRLFTITSQGRGTSGFTLSYKFLPSSQPVPGSEPHVFVNKAEVMEDQSQVVIEPLYSSTLSFEYDGKQVFSDGPIVVDNPGGDGVKGTLGDTFTNFFRASVVNKNPAYVAVIKSEKQKVIKAIRSIR